MEDNHLNQQFPTQSNFSYLAFVYSTYNLSSRDPLTYNHQFDLCHLHERKTMHRSR